MARRSKRRYKRNRKLVKIPVTSTLSLAGIGSGGITDGNATTIMARDFFAVGFKGDYSIKDFTASEGPVKIGWAHGDYTSTEVQEMLNAENIDDSDKITNEKARRLVRPVGKFAGFATDEVLQDGRLIWTRLGFTLQEGIALSHWAINRSGGTWTSGVVTLDGHLWGLWL